MPTRAPGKLVTLHYRIGPRAGFPPGMSFEQGALVEFSSPEGTLHAGIVRAANDHEGRVDFNHPLAGRAVRFEIEVLAVL